MTPALNSAVAEATKLPPDKQDALAAILLEEIASEKQGISHEKDQSSFGCTTG